MEDAIIIFVTITAFVAGYFVMGRFGREVDEIRRARFLRKSRKGAAGYERRQRRCGWCLK